MNGLGIGDCLKRFLCCFPRVYAWFLSTGYDYSRQRPSWNVDALGNDYAETYVGNGYCGGYSQPADRRTPPASGYMNGVTFDSQEDWKFVTGCGIRSYGIKQDGSLWGWGEGLLGDGTITASGVPTPIGTGPWKCVSTSFSHTLAVKEDGTLWAWGENHLGQLGNGVFGSTPVGFASPAPRTKVTSSIGSVAISSPAQYSKPPSVRFTYRDSSGQEVGGEGGGAAGFAKMAYRLYGNGPEYPWPKAKIESAGSGYTSIPAVRIISGDPPKEEGQITLTAIFEVESVEVQDAGDGYTSPPTVTAPGASGFSATAIVSGGRVTAVEVTSAGTVELSSNGDGGRQRTIPVVINGTGTGASAVARLGRGFISKALITRDGRGYLTPPSFEVVGGGGSGATISCTCVGTVSGVTVTNGGSGYSLTDGDNKSIVAAIERQGGDVFSGEASGQAKLNPGPVTISWSEADRASYLSNTFWVGSFFTGRSGRVAAFSMPLRLAGNVVEAKIVGGGLTWETGIPLTHSGQGFDSTLEYDGSSEYGFYSAPYVSYTFSSLPYAPYPLVAGFTQLVYEGENPAKAIDDAWDVDYELGPFAKLGAGAPYFCWDTCWRTIVANESGNVADFVNSLRGELSGWGAFASFPQVPFASIKGTPSISFQPDGGASASLFDIFDGTAFFNLSDPGSTFHRAVRTFEPMPDGGSTCFTGDGPGGCGGTWVPEKRKKEVVSIVKSGQVMATLDDCEQEPLVSAGFADLPEGVWAGPKGKPGRAYFVFGGRGQNGCFSVGEEGLQVHLPGGLYSEPPTITFVGSSSPIPIQVTGEWSHCEAGETSSGYYGQASLSRAVTASGDIFEWGVRRTGGVPVWAWYFGGYGLSQVFGNLPAAVTPQSIGRPAIISVSWNKEQIPAVSWNSPRSYTIGANRFFTLGPPEHTPAASAAVLSSQRISYEYKFFPDEIPRASFGGAGFGESGDVEADTGGGWLVGASVIPMDCYFNKFSTPPINSYEGGSGYTSPPTILFSSRGDPLASVSVSLAEVPPFEKIEGDFALTEDGELWSLTGGIEIVDADFKVVARKAVFEPPSPIVNGYVLSASPGFAIATDGESETCYKAGTSVWKSVNWLYTRSQAPFLYSNLKGPVTHETVDSVDVISGFYLILDNGGSGFDNYSNWMVRITLPSEIVGGPGLTYSTQFSGPTTKVPAWTSEKAQKYNEILVEAESGCPPGDRWPSQRFPQDPEVREYDTLFASGVKHSRTESISRSSVSRVVEHFMAPWCGSLRPPTGLSTGVVFLPAPNTIAGQDLLVEFLCVSGTSGYESLPSYRVVEVKGFSRSVSGQRRIDGSWSDFDIESGVRKLYKGSFPTYCGFAAPGEEGNFVRIDNGVGLKADGSLWRLGSPGVSPSRVMGNLELRVASPGKGYKAPVLAEISQQHAGVAKATATFDGKVVAVGVDNQGAGYRSPPQLSVSGGAQLQAVILGPVDSVTVSAGGSEYKNPPRVIFSTPGVSASGKASMTGSVSSVWVVDGGEGYATPPSISMGGNATATATIKGYVNSVIVNNGGLYSSAPSVNFSGGSGSGASAVAVMARSGDSLRVSSVVVTNSGSGYTSPPSVSFSGDGSGATATAVLNASVDSVSLTSGGSGYEDHPSVSVDGPARRNAALAALCSLGVDSVSVVNGGSYRAAPTASFQAVGEISSVNLTSSGSGYFSAPEVKILGGLGSGAEAACTISASIQDFIVTNGGSGYQYPPYVLITGGRRPSQSTQAKATAVLSGGVVSSISVGSGGSGYYEQPTVAFKFPVSAIADASVSNGSVSGVEVLSGGCWYTDPPQVVFEGAGTGAAATAQVQNGVITSVNITSGGSGYSTPPKVNFVVPKGGRGAQAAAVLSGEVDSIKLISCGVNYDQDALPEVLFIGGGGSGASASVSVAKSGSGGSATTTINGSVIYAKIIDQGSGYQDEPTVTASESTNFILQKASEDYANELIGEEEYNEIRNANAAVIRAGIAGKVTGVSVDSGGSNYVPGLGRSHDQHGNRKPSRAVLRGPTTLSASESSGSGCFCGVAESLTSSSQNGGGAITSITPPSNVDFVRRPSVHFSDSVGASVCTRLKVSSAGVRKGSGMDVTRINTWQNSYFSDMSIIAYGLSYQYETSVTQRQYFAFLGNTAESPYGAARDWTGCGQIPDGHRGMESKPVSGTINTHDFACDLFSARLFSGKYVRGPRLGIESSKGERQEWQLPQDVSSNQEVLIPGNSKHSSDIVGVVVDPGVVEVVSPQFQVTLSEGRVVSASASGPAKFDAIWGSGDLVVHGGGGAGAKLSFSISGDSMTVYVVDGGRGYRSQPSVKWVLPEKSYGPRTLGESGYLPTYPLSETWPRFPTRNVFGIINVTGGELVEYITGSTGDGYISTRGNYPISQVGIYPFFKDGFVSDAYLMDAGYPTQDFDGPAFLKHYTSPPSVTLYGGSPEEQASVQASVVEWTDKFSGKGGCCVAVRETQT
jgi:hypothetical protein